MEQIRIAEVPIDELMTESWEGTLERLTADMDPWDIDIAELAQRYRQYLDALHELRFEIPGRMVLTCSILLRMKSDDLLAACSTDQSNLIEELEEVVEETAAEGDEPIEPEEFSLPLIRRPRRQVTLEDLRLALTAAMTVSRRRAERLIDRMKDDVDEFSPFQIGGEDFTDRLRLLFAKIKKLLSGRRVVSFFRLLERGDKEERIRRFFEVLLLAAQGEIDCYQEEFLGDILITLEGEG
ncbi:segregation/condensation protein A [Candidatus Bipolaricaulota bacterium]|nr:segregation/condensation protein A [Candidatus Bipolaricaulota bacterium]